MKKKPQREWIVKPGVDSDVKLWKDGRLWCVEVQFLRDIELVGGYIEGVPVGGALAGFTFKTSTKAKMDETLEWIREHGYMVPDVTLGP